MYKHQLILLLILMISGCVSNRTETRPSPLAADSVQLNDGLVKITYSSPGVKKRKIWGNLVPWDHLWRTGANQATYLTTTKDLLIDNQFLSAGSYSIFTIPSNAEWIVILNKDWDQWGAYNYNEEKDALRISVRPVISEQFQERMKFSLDENNLLFHWEYLTFSIPISTVNP